MSDGYELPEIPELPELPDLFLEGVNRIRPASELQEMTKDEWGPLKWAELHAWADSIPCPECRVFAVQAATAMHDLVNIKLGKRVHDEVNLRAFVADVDELVKKAGL